MADGNELGLDGVRGKIRSLRSSSALAVNFFDYWRGGKIAVLGENGLGSPGGLSELRFERKSPLDFAGILQTSMSLPIPRKCPWPSNASLPNHTAAIRPTRR